jgi:hypothetical protein
VTNDQANGIIPQFLRSLKIGRVEPGRPKTAVVSKKTKPENPDKATVPHSIVFNQPVKIVIVNPPDDLHSWLLPYVKSEHASRAMAEIFRNATTSVTQSQQTVDHLVLAWIQSLKINPDIADTVLWLEDQWRSYTRDHKIEQKYRDEVWSRFLWRALQQYRSGELIRRAAIHVSLGERRNAKCTIYVSENPLEWEAQL